MLLSVVSVLVVAQSSTEIPEGLMNNPVFIEVDPTDFLKESQTALFKQSFLLLAE